MNGGMKREFHRTLILGGSIILSGIIVLAVLGLWTAHIQQSSNQNWCSTLQLLTSHPVPKPADPAANPSRVEAYQLYEDFVTLRQRLGC